MGPEETPDGPLAPLEGQRLLAVAVPADRPGLLAETERMVIQLLVDKAAVLAVLAKEQAL